tara:strand:- start:2530 stop:4257 length:1728 start_codon:yes stop_codon:yes gene_type:complete
VTKIKPRDYQIEAVESVCEYLTKHDGDPVICAPTGAGKSVILSMLTERFIKAGRRVMMATHVGELVKQNAAAMGRFGVDVGLFAAGLGKRDTKQDAIACQIQSAYSKADRFGTRHALIIDEAHTVNPDESAVRYRQFIEDLRGFNPGLRVIGLTATPYRTGTGSICGPDGFFDEIVYDIPIKMLIERGYLSNVTTETSGFKLDIGSLRTRMGEYVTQDLENLFGSENNVQAACEDMLRSTADRKSVIIFGVSVAHAMAIRDVLKGITGQEVEVVHGEMSKGDREKAIDNFKSGRVKYLVNVNVLTTGFDAPNIDCVAIMRATQSPGLLAQIVGRGLRVSDGKENCLVLDYGENFERHGPIDSPNFGKASKSKGEGQPVGRARCMVCQNELLPGKRECGNCGFINPTPDTSPTHDGEAAYGAQVLQDCNTMKVSGCEYNCNPGRNGKRDTFRVTYYCVGVTNQAEGDLLGRDNTVKEWLCFDHDHDSWSYRQAVKWWKRRSNAPAPESVMEAVDLARRGALAKCTGITTEKQGKYDKVTACVLGDKPTEWKGETMLEGAELFSEDFNWDNIADLPF